MAAATSSLRGRPGEHNWEKLNLSLAWYILVLHQKSPKSSVQAELGRRPFGVDVIKRIYIFYDHLQRSSNSLLSEALILFNSIPPKCRKIWGSSCEFHFNLIQVNHETPISKQKIKQICSSSYIAFWENKIKSEQKMRVYKTLKLNLYIWGISLHQEH